MHNKFRCRAVATVVSILLIVLTIQGQESVQPDRPRIGLALSGGGARELAHIGVLRFLEEHRIPIDHIAGTSIGGVLAGLYGTWVACGD